MAKAKTPKQIAIKIRSLKRQITRLEHQKKNAAKKKPARKKAAKKRRPARRKKRR